MAIQSNQFPSAKRNFDGADSWLCDRCKPYGFCLVHEADKENEVTIFIQPEAAPKKPKELEDLLPQRVSFATFATNDWPLVNEVLDAYHNQQYALAIQLAEALLQKYDGWILRLVMGLAAYHAQDYKKAHENLSHFDANKQPGTLSATQLQELQETCFVLQELDFSQTPKAAVEQPVQRAVRKRESVLL